MKIMIVMTMIPICQRRVKPCHVEPVAQSQPVEATRSTRAKHDCDMRCKTLRINYFLGHGGPGRSDSQAHLKLADVSGDQCMCVCVCVCV